MQRRSSKWHKQTYFYRSKGPPSQTDRRPIRRAVRRPVCRAAAEIESLAVSPARLQKPGSARFCRHRWRRAAAAFCVNHREDRERSGCHICRDVLSSIAFRATTTTMTLLWRPGTYGGMLGLRARVLSPIHHVDPPVKEERFSSFQVSGSAANSMREKTAYLCVKRYAFYTRSSQRSNLPCFRWMLISSRANLPTLYAYFGLRSHSARNDVRLVQS